MIKRIPMRSAMTMIELIFAIVVIAISVMTIPSMMNVADKASKAMMIDEDILKRMMGEITKVSQARWDRNSTAPDFNPLQIAGDLVCDRNVSGTPYRRNPDSSMMCSNNPPMMAVTPATGSLNLSQGIEQLHNQEYNMSVTRSDTVNVYRIPIKYNVGYVDANISAINNTGVATSTWQLGSSTAMNPNPAGTATHLKRIVVRSNTNNPNVDMTLTFFKSNVGKFSE
jgi:hypothetical protein